MMWNQEDIGIQLVGTKKNIANLVLSEPETRLSIKRSFILRLTNASAMQEIH